MVSLSFRANSQHMERTTSPDFSKVLMPSFSKITPTPQAFNIAVATAMVGPISFLGLIIANLSRQLLKTYRHAQLILGSALFGMIVLVGGQLLVEHAYSYTIPVSVFITVGGGVYFLYLLLTNRRT